MCAGGTHRPAGRHGAGQDARRREVTAAGAAETAAGTAAENAAEAIAKAAETTPETTAKARGNCDRNITRYEREG